MLMLLAIIVWPQWFNLLVIGYGFWIGMGVVAIQHISRTGWWQNPIPDMFFEFSTTVFFLTGLVEAYRWGNGKSYWYWLLAITGIIVILARGIRLIADFWHESWGNPSTFRRHRAVSLDEA